MHLADQKQALRDSINHRIERMSKKDRDAEERSLLRRIKKHIGSEPKTIAAFVPLKDEVDLRPLLRELLNEGWTLFLPVMSGNKLGFRQALDLEHFMRGPFGIPEPPQSAPRYDPNTLDIVLVPGRAYTKDGKRMGRGNGGYDMWIRKQREANPRTQFIGVALECQIVDELPMEEHDEVVDFVCTARGKGLGTENI